MKSIDKTVAIICTKPDYEFALNEAERLQNLGYPVFHPFPMDINYDLEGKSNGFCGIDVNIKNANRADIVYIIENVVKKQKNGIYEESYEYAFDLIRNNIIRKDSKYIYSSLDQSPEFYDPILYTPTIRDLPQHSPVVTVVFGDILGNKSCVSTSIDKYIDRICYILKHYGFCIFTISPDELSLVENGVDPNSHDGLLTRAASMKLQLSDYVLIVDTILSTNFEIHEVENKSPDNNTKNVLSIISSLIQKNENLPIFKLSNDGLNKLIASERESFAFLNPFIKLM